MSAGGWVGITTDPVVAWAAVPDVGARPSATRPSPPGAYATIRWSRSATAGRPQARCLAPHRHVSYAGPGGQPRILQRAHTIGNSLTGSWTNRSAARTDPRSHWWGTSSTLRPAQPISDRPARGQTETAPTPPTRAHRAAPTSCGDHRVRRRTNAPAATNTSGITAAAPGRPRSVTSPSSPILDTANSPTVEAKGSGDHGGRPGGRHHDAAGAPARRTDLRTGPVAGLGPRRPGVKRRGGGERRIRTRQAFERATRTYFRTRIGRNCRSYRDAQSR
jgi:hypothetical protein